MRSLNKKVLFLVAVAPILMAEECGVNIPNYQTAHTANESVYLAKPSYDDTCAHALYVSGKFSHTTRALLPK